MADSAENVQEYDKYAFLLGSALRNEDEEQFFSIYDRILPENLPESKLEGIKETARLIADLPEDKFNELVVKARDFSLAQGPGKMTSFGASDFEVSEDQASNAQDHFVVYLPPYQPSSELPLKLPDSDSGLHDSSKATGSLKNSLSSTDGEELQDGEEEYGRGAYDYFSRPESTSRHVKFSHNTHNYDESHEVESDKSSVESPRSDGSSTQEYEVTQPEDGIFEMKTFSSSSSRDLYENSDFGDINVHKKLYGQSFPAFSFPHTLKGSRDGCAGSGYRQASGVDDGIPFSQLNKPTADGVCRYSRQYTSEDFTRSSPPFGEGKEVFSRVASSIDPLLQKRSLCTAKNLPRAERIDQNGSPDADGRKKKKKKKTSTGPGGRDDVSQEDGQRASYKLDINGNPDYMQMRELPRRKDDHRTRAFGSLKHPTYGTIQHGDSEPYTNETSGALVRNTDEGNASVSEHRKGKLRKRSKNEHVILSHEISNYKGNAPLEDILKFVNGRPVCTKKGNKKCATDAPSKDTAKSDVVKKSKISQSPNPASDEKREKDVSMSVGLENMGGKSGKSEKDEPMDMNEHCNAKEGKEVPVVGKEEMQMEQLPVREQADDSVGSQENKTRNSAKQLNDKSPENNNVKKQNKTESSKPSKKPEKEGAVVGNVKKAKDESEPLKEEGLATSSTPQIPGSEPRIDLPVSSDYMFTDLDIGKPKMEEEFMPVTNKKKRQKAVMKEVFSVPTNNYHAKENRSGFPARSSTLPLSEGLAGDKGNHCDLSLSGFPALGKKAGSSRKSAFRRGRRNSIGEVPMDTSLPVQDDSDIESVKSLPAAQGGWMAEPSPHFQVSYAKMVAASKPETPGAQGEGGNNLKSTVWKGSLTERRHSIGSKPEKLKPDSAASGDLRSRHKSGSQEVLKTDEKECVAVSKSQVEPAAVEAALGPCSSTGLASQNIEAEFPQLPGSPCAQVACCQVKAKPPVTHVQSAHCSCPNADVPSGSAAVAVSNPVRVTNAVAAPRSPLAPVAGSTSDSPAAVARSQSGEAVDACKDLKKGKPAASRVWNSNSRKHTPVFFCDRKSESDLESLDITFGYDSSIDDEQSRQHVGPQQLGHQDPVSFGVDCMDSSLNAPPPQPPAPLLSQPPPPPGDADSSKAKLMRLNGVVTGACKLEGSPSVVRPSNAPSAGALGPNSGGPTVSRVEYGSKIPLREGEGPRVPKFVSFREIPESRGSFNVEEVTSWFQQTWERVTTAKNSDGSPAVYVCPSDD